MMSKHSEVDVHVHPDRHFDWDRGMTPAPTPITAGFNPAMVGPAFDAGSRAVSGHIEHSLTQQQRFEFEQSRNGHERFLDWNAWKTSARHFGKSISGRSADARSSGRSADTHRTVAEDSIRPIGLTTSMTPSIWSNPVVVYPPLPSLHARDVFISADVTSAEHIGGYSGGRSSDRSDIKYSKDKKEDLALKPLLSGVPDLTQRSVMENALKPVLSTGGVASGVLS